MRGLLGFNCNGALGQFRDRRDLMLRAIAYLGRDDVTAMGDLPQFGIGRCFGPTDTGRPADEPDEPEAA